MLTGSVSQTKTNRPSAKTSGRITTTRIIISPRCTGPRTTSTQATRRAPRPHASYTQHQITTTHRPASRLQSNARLCAYSTHRPISYHHDAQAATYVKEREPGTTSTQSKTVCTHTPHRPTSDHHDAHARGTRKARLRVPTRVIVRYRITTARRTAPRHHIYGKQARGPTCLIDPHHITTTNTHAAHAKRDCVCRHA